MSLVHFVSAYVECAFWSNTDSDDRPLNDTHDICNVAPEAMESIRTDCKDFYDAHCNLWRSVHMDDEQAGHDFWLTRNAHGTGFWDRDIGDVGDKLTAVCKLYGTSDLYIGDDNLIYVA